jgi:predicted Zn-dependent peptidase
MTGQVEITTLDHGLRVATFAMPAVRTAAVALVADVGARHEAPEQHGLAHLFEHMLFKGTASRGARDIAEAIEDVGGALNAWTSREGTMFHGRVLARDIPLAVDLLSDLVCNPRFDPQDLELERQVVLSEIGEASDTPEDLVFDLAQATAFPDQPLGRPILGTAESLAGLSETSLRQWRERHYVADRLLLVAAGAVDHAELVSLAQKHLARLPSSAPIEAQPARWAGGVMADRRRSEQTHLVISLPGPGLYAPDHYAAQLWATALGGGMSSRLFQDIREERGLAYSVSAFHQPHADIGITSLYLATRPADAQKAAGLAMEIAQALAADLQPAELDRARAQLKAGLLMGLEACAGQADWIGRTILAFGRAVPVAEVEAAIDAVSVEEAREAGRAMLDATPALASIGPRPLSRLP